MLFSRTPKSYPPGQEPWRDPTLPDNVRWKEWHKAKERERQANSTTGYITSYYKARGNGKGADAAEKGEGGEGGKKKSSGRWAAAGYWTSCLGWMCIDE